MRLSRIVPKLVTVTACTSVALLASSPGVTWAKQAPVVHSSPRWDAALTRARGGWGRAEKVPGISVLEKGNAGGNTTSVSCASAGNCSAVGQYLDSSAHQQVFVVNQVNGTWRNAEEVPGMAALNAFGRAQITPVSCGAVGNCSAGGYYGDISGNQQAFVVSRT